MRVGLAARLRGHIPGSVFQTQVHAYQVHLYFRSARRRGAAKNSDRQRVLLPPSALAGECVPARRPGGASAPGSWACASRRGRAVGTSALVGTERWWGPYGLKRPMAKPDSDLRVARPSASPQVAGVFVLWMCEKTGNASQLKRSA